VTKRLREDLLSEGSVFEIPQDGHEELHHSQLRSEPWGNYDPKTEFPAERIDGMVDLEPGEDLEWVALPLSIKHQKVDNFDISAMFEQMKRFKGVFDNSLPEGLKEAIQEKEQKTVGAVVREGVIVSQTEDGKILIEEFRSDDGVK